ncbi:MAG: bifunctional phosphoglucose/phosphomannose isomerase [Patescibacteria group bacterium]
MENLIENFSAHIQEAIIIGEKATLSQKERQFKNVLITGMGGSGIGGAIASEIASIESPIPFSISKGYSVPQFVNTETLVIVSSYSGGTEETISAMKKAQEKGAKIVCITSGGEIEKIAKENNIDHIIIPGGMPPRAALGYSLVQMFFIFNYFGLIKDSFKDELLAGVSMLNTEKENIKQEAKKIAEKLYGTLPVIYAPYGSEGVAVRFKQQLNENAKMLCWYGVVPEMNHNELVGWAGGNEHIAVIIFRNQSDYLRISKRIDISKEVISKYTPNITEIYSKGNSLIERALYHIHLGDFISLYLANMKEVDVTDIKVIEYLKASLAEIKD